MTGMETAACIAAQHWATISGRSIMAAPKHPAPATRSLGQPQFKLISSYLQQIGCVTGQTTSPQVRLLQQLAWLTRIPPLSWQLQPEWLGCCRRADTRLGAAQGGTKATCSSGIVRYIYKGSMTTCRGCHPNLSLLGW